MSWNCVAEISTGMDLPPFLTQLVKAQNPWNGDLSHGLVTQDVYQGVQAGCRAAAESGQSSGIDPQVPGEGL